jgi:hypothetical protein
LDTTFTGIAIGFAKFNFNALSCIQGLPGVFTNLTIRERSQQEKADEKKERFVFCHCFGDLISFKCKQFQETTNKTQEAK